MSARQNRDHAARATRRDLTAVVVMAIFLATAGGYGIGRMHASDLNAIADDAVSVERVERAGACRCAVRGGLNDH